MKNKKNKSDRRSWYASAPQPLNNVHFYNLTWRKDKDKFFPPPKKNPDSLIGVPDQKSWLNPFRYNYVPLATTIQDNIASWVCKRNHFDVS